jgi:hypothetical protein
MKGVVVLQVLIVILHFHLLKGLHLGSCFELISKMSPDQRYITVVPRDPGTCYFGSGSTP